MAIAHSNPNRVYALIETGDGVPWNGQPTDAARCGDRDDGGETWRVVSYDHNAMGRAALLLAHGRRARRRGRGVLPDGVVSPRRSTAAQTLTVLPRDQAPGGDHHDIWIDPTNAEPA